MWTTSTGMAFSLTRVPALGKGGALFFLRLWRARRSPFCSLPRSCAIRRLHRSVTRDQDHSVVLVELDIDDAHPFGIFDFLDALLLPLDRLVAAAAERAQS